MSTTFKTVSEELPDRPCTCNRFRNVISKRFRLHISENLFIPMRDPAEYFVSISYSVACASVELLYYREALYFIWVS